MISQIYGHWPYLHQVQNLRIWLKDMYPFMQLDVNLDLLESITLGPVGALADFQGLGHLLRIAHHLHNMEWLSPLDITLVPLPFTHLTQLHYKQLLSPSTCYKLLCHCPYLIELVISEVQDLAMHTNTSPILLTQLWSL